MWSDARAARRLQTPLFGPPLLAPGMSVIGKFGIGAGDVRGSIGRRLAILTTKDAKTHEGDFPRRRGDMGGAAEREG